MEQGVEEYRSFNSHLSSAKCLYQVFHHVNSQGKVLMFSSFCVQDNNEDTFAGNVPALLDGIFLRSSSMGVNGAVVSAITSTTLQYDRSRFLAMHAMSSAT